MRRVALLIHSIQPYRVPLLREMVRRCRDFRVFVSVKEPASSPCLLEGLSVHCQRTATIRQRRSHPVGFREDLSIIIPYDTLPALVRFRPDVVISTEMGPRSLQALVYRRTVRQSRLVLWAAVSEHTEIGRGLARNGLRRFMLRRADAVMVNGTSGERYVCRLGAPIERVFRVPYSTDVDLFARCPIERTPEQRHRLLYVGRLVESKGLLPFLSVLRSWATGHPDFSVEMWIAGEGPVRPAVEAFEVPNNLTLKLLGKIDYHQLPATYMQAGIFAFPTLGDEWGMAAAEAMASGLPVIGSEYSQAIEELIRDGDSGWLFRPDQRDACMRALDRALRTGPERLTAMGHAAREAAIRLSPSNIADRITSAIESACRH